MKATMPRFAVFGISMVLAVALSGFGTACGGGDGGGSDTGGPDTTTDPGKDVVLDIPGYDAPGKDMAPEAAKDIPKDEGNPSKCDPACDYQGFQYCDEAAEACKDMMCVSCYKDTHCEADEMCLDYVFKDGTHASVCSGDCVTDGDCKAGFNCDVDAGACVPLALCKPDPCGDGKLGDACEYKTVNEGCAPCDDGLNCGGREPIADTACMWDADCLTYGIPWQQNPQCVFGLCGTSYCSQPCDAGDCPAGFAPVSTLFACNCIPVGTSQAGEACPIFNVNLEAEACGAYLTCIGIESTPEGDPCTTDAECPDTSYIANGQCVDGFCGSSFCCAECDANEECLEGFGPINVSGTCFCAPMEEGDAVAGDPCPIFNVNMDKDLCAHGLTCIGIEATDEGDPCTVADDCPIWEYFGNPVCVDGFCGTSFCSPKCDENDDCEDAFGPISVSDKCYCAPKEVGDSAAGEPCPIFGVNEGADACKTELTCLGIPANEGGIPCGVDGDCAKTSFPGGAQCLEGICGTSFCAPKCDGEGNCEAGYRTIDVDDKCYCEPEQTGDSAPGDACPMGNVNTDAVACGETFDCLGLSAFDWSGACETADQCPAFGGMAADCTLGHCGLSACAEACDENGACATAGLLPYLVNGDACFCLAGLAAGGTPEGGACPFVNVNLAAETCAANLTCFGLLAFPEDGVTCETAADCDAAANPGVIECVNGNCGSTFCAAQCDGEGACEAGFEPFVNEDDRCYCAPAAVE